MAEQEKQTSLFADMFKQFPIATIVGCLVIVYLVWRATGGVERGLERHAQGKDSLFLKVTNVTPSHGSKEYFGVIKQEEIQQSDERRKEED